MGVWNITPIVEDVFGYIASDSVLVTDSQDDVTSLPNITLVILAAIIAIPAIVIPVYIVKKKRG